MSAIRPAAVPRISLPDAPALAAGHGRAALITTDGEVIVGDAATVLAALREMPPPVLVHAPATWRRLGVDPRAQPDCLDLLELFAFACPARRAAPTARGLALALGLDAGTGGGPEAAASLISTLIEALLTHLARGADHPGAAEAAGSAARMGLAGWGWAPFVTTALGRPDAVPGADSLRPWKRLPSWEESAALPPPSSHPVGEAEARSRLAALLGPDAEQRPGQADYAGAAAAAFAPRARRGDPALVLAEAGTGIGKTLGYIAPASVWAERNAGSVWISTYTRHLQRQIGAELARLFPDPIERRRRVVVRKGRENYLCLLNLEDATSAAGASSPSSTSPLIVPLGLLARWLPATEDGDLQGGDLPGWFAELFGAGLLAGLADRRGECIHASCPHWKRCFIEHTIRRARGADLVVANHALVMTQAALGGLDDDAVPQRYVFDEGHHVFDAADAAFAAALSGAETAELRRWLLGAEGSRSRSRGLRARIEEVVAGRDNLIAPMDAALMAARALPRAGWAERISIESEGGDLAEPADGDPDGRGNPTEALLRLVRRQVLARTAGDGDPGMSAECDLHPTLPALPAAAARLQRALRRIEEPLKTLVTRLRARLEDEADELDETTRGRIEAAARTIDRRALNPLAAWIAMLIDVQAPPTEPGTRPDHVLFLRLDRRAGFGRWRDGEATHADRDAGLHRHWLDPTLPFALTLARPAHGLLITSATLRDAGVGGVADADDPEPAWLVAEERVGAPHLPSPAIRASVASPFDYAAQTRAFIVTDVAGGDIAQLAGAYRALFMAAEGGALGLFTAISRLRAVHGRIAPALEAAGLPLYAQHVDPMDNATLVDILRAEEESCLLGTDAMRDGVDVPGRALRLVVFERVPWPRPDILHRERRTHLGGGEPGGYDDRVARLRLRQAFGRLVRRATDRGVFVLLDRRMPSRLLTAFPPGVAVRRSGLAETVAEAGAFLHGDGT